MSECSGPHSAACPCYDRGLLAGYRQGCQAVVQDLPAAIARVAWWRRLSTRRFIGALLDELVAGADEVIRRRTELESRRRP